MIQLACVALGFAAGLLTGGSLRNAAEYPLRGLALPALAYAVKMGAALLLNPQTGAAIVCCVQYGLLASFFLLNARAFLWPGVSFTGAFLNFLVILLNGGCMPVAARLLTDGPARAQQLAAGRVYAYTVVDAHTVLPFLGDVLALGTRARTFGFASVGDLLLCVGVGALCFFVTRGVAGYARPMRGKARRGERALFQEKG